MKFAMALAVVVLPLALGGCMGPAGNPNGMAYADEPGGAIAAPPQSLGTVSYDPSAPVAPFADMKAGTPAGGLAPIDTSPYSSAPPPAR